MHLTLTLDGSGAGVRATGVGFLDHMLDLLARHGRMDLDVSVSGDLQTGAHHTAEDTAIVLGQALDRALGDRVGIVRYGSASVPMDEARASCAIDISGRPFTLFEADLPPGSTGGFEHELHGGVLPRARERRQAHAAPACGSRQQRPPHDRGRLQGVRASAARGRLDRSDRDWRPEHEGHADRMTEGIVSLIDEPVEIAVVDYGMGNRRSVEKALEHVGARAIVTREHEQLRAAAGLVVPGVGAFPRAMDNLRELGLDQLLRERVDAGTPVLGICLGMQLAFEHSTELGGADGLGIVPGEVRALDTGELKLPHIGWNEVRFTRPDSPLVADLPRTLRLLPRALVRPRARRRRGRPRRRRVRSAVRQRCAARLVLRRAVPPREVLRCRAAPARQLRAHLHRRRGACRPAGRRQVRLYPAIDILGGNAVRLVRATSTRRRSTTRTRCRPRAAGSERAPSTCTSSTSTAPRPASL